jgi:hypothetical protein
MFRGNFVLAFTLVAKLRLLGGANQGWMRLC